MASEIKSDKLSPSGGTALQIGDASDTITIPTGATFTITDGLGIAGGGTGLTSFTAGDVLYATGTTTLAKLAKGTAEQVLAMNSGATAPEWVTAGGGTTVKRHYFEFATRTVGNISGSTDQFTYTTSFVPIDPSVNDFYVETVIPCFQVANGGIGAGLSFLDGAANRDSYFCRGLGYTYVGGSYQNQVNQAFNIAAGELAAGTFTITWRTNTASSNATEYCPNSSDDSRIDPQTSATLMITEYKN